MEVSVIIPVYNSASFLERTIESVLNQTYTDFELLLIDDGSTDNSSQVIHKYLGKDRRIKYFYKENGGVSSARNLGLQKAMGKYISFLDSDDYWVSVFLEKMYLKITAENKLVCYCGYIERCQTYEVYYPKSFNTQDVLIGKLQGDSYRTHTDSWLINRFFLQREQIVFTVGCHLLEDFEFFVKLLFKATPLEITFVPEYLTYYILRSASLTNQDKLVLPLSIIEQVIEVYKRVYHWMNIEIGGTKDKYSFYLQQTIKRSYIKFLWDQLLLGRYRDFEIIKKWYERDQEIYFANQPISGFKNKIWRICVQFKYLSCVCRIFLRPYKYIKRKWKIKQL